MGRGPDSALQRNAATLRKALATFSFSYDALLGKFGEHSYASLVLSNLPVCIITPYTHAKA